LIEGIFYAIRLRGKIYVRLYMRKGLKMWKWLRKNWWKLPFVAIFLYTAIPFVLFLPFLGILLYDDVFVIPDYLCYESDACNEGKTIKKCGRCGEVEECTITQDTCENLFFATWIPAEKSWDGVGFCNFAAIEFQEEICLRGGGEWKETGIFFKEHECDFSSYCISHGMPPYKQRFSKKEQAILQGKDM
jgi:hypothetical protein